MSLVCFHSVFQRVALTLRLPLLYAVTWTVQLVVTVTLVSLAPGMAFVMATSPSSPFSKLCEHHAVGETFVRIPLDFPREIVCLPERAVMNSSHLDFFLPALFAALVVAASTCLLRSLACGGPEKKPVSRSVKAGLQFPVGRIGRYLKKGRYSQRVGTGAPVYLSSVLEFLAAEVLELAGNATRDNKKNVIIPRHIPKIEMSQRIGARLFVSRLSFFTSKEQFKTLFSQFGQVTDAHLVMDARTGRPKGFGFVSYESEVEAEKAMKAMNGRIVNGRMIFVEPAIAK
ncbi:hypothetical protein VNO77_28999 [Canavalia gladiata]|uniref:Histone H2A n=1 Tax=Canavalia gladiata TaxID=3824 RepID=A0AAN9Q817_CANGL